MRIRFLQIPLTFAFAIFKMPPIAIVFSVIASLFIILNQYQQINNKVRHQYRGSWKAYFKTFKPCGKITKNS